MNKKTPKRILISLVLVVSVVLMLLIDDIVPRLLFGTVALVTLGFILLILMDIIKTRKDKGSSGSPSELSSLSMSDDDSEHVSEDGEEFFIVKPNNPPMVRGGFTDSTETVKPHDIYEKYKHFATEDMPGGNDEYDKQFNFALDKILTIIQKSMDANTAIFFWYNEKNQKLIIGGSVSVTEKDLCSKGRKLDVETDFVSKIAKTGAPEFLNSIAPNTVKDNLLYYATPVKVQSVIGVPLFYQDKVTAVMVVDSMIADAFGVETTYLLGRYARLINMLITLFTGQVDEQISASRLTGILNVVGRIDKLDKLDKVIDEIADIVSTMLHWDFFTYCSASNIEKQWRVMIVKGGTTVSYIEEGAKIDRGSLVEKALTKGEFIYRPSMESEQFKRFSNKETITDSGGFLVVPMFFSDGIFGLLTFETLKPDPYSKADLEFIKSISMLFSFIIYNYSRMELYERYIMLDFRTNFLKNNFFLAQVTKEHERATIYRLGSSLMLIELDDFHDEASLFNASDAETVMLEIAKIVQRETDSRATIGRMSVRQIGVFLFGMNVQDSFLLAERIRQSVPRTVIKITGSQSTFSVSIGLVGCDGKNKIPELIQTAEMVLASVKQNGGNKVTAHH